MRTKQDKNGKYAFDYTPDGFFFLGGTHVAILDRNSGRQVRVTLESLRTKLTLKKMNMIESDLMMDNNFMNNDYHIVGLADR